MESNPNYTLVGLFVVVMIGLLIGIGFWLSTNYSGVKYTNYIVYMNEAVSGLSEQAPVKYSGVTVGYVKKISLNPKNPQQVRLLLAIEDDAPITESTVATLMAQGVTGITYVGLKATTATAPKLLPKPGQQDPVIASEPSLLLQLDSALRELSTDLQVMSNRFGQLLNENNLKAIGTTLHNLTIISDNFANNTAQIDSTLKESNVLIKNLAKTSQNLPETLQSIRTATNQLNTTMEMGQMTLQAISQQALPGMVQSMNQLEQIMTSMQSLTSELQRNPAILIRGKSEAPVTATQ